MRTSEKMADMRAFIGPVSLAVLPVAVWPGIERPFSTPKVTWLIAASVLLLATPVRGGGTPVPWLARWTALAWIASFLAAGAAATLPSLPALALGLSAPLFALAIVRRGDPPVTLLSAQTAGAAACGAVALAQWAGVDPFVAAGWYPPIDGASVRMRVYGTLGNPNFVGVLMAATFPATLAVIGNVKSSAGRWLAGVALAVQAAALVATGSRGAVLGLAAGVSVYAGLRWSRRVRIGLVAVAILAAAAVLVSPARPIDTTAAGRVYLWRVVAGHVLEAPLLGHGPGAVALHFADWQRVAATEGIRDRRFAGLTDHVHNDYLEALVERGVPGLVSLCLPLLAVLVTTGRAAGAASPLLAGTAAAAAAGAACALVDFPLARPAELAWWWVAIVLALVMANGETGSVEERHV